MENRFKDLPCLYYLDKRADKKNNIQFYAMLASMFGQTPEQAAQSSKLFAHASGKLFGGVGFTAEEILHDAGNAFTKPYKDCRGFYRKKAYSEAGLKDSCCIICPYSHSYANNVLDYERQVLRIIIGHRDWIETVGCSTSDFRSYLALSCTNDISEYPIIPFNALLFEYLMRNNEVKIDAVAIFMRDEMASRGHIISDSVLNSFVTLQLDIINRTALLNDDISSLYFVLASLRESVYTPPQLVHLASGGDDVAGKRNETVSKKVNNLVQLFQDYENMTFIEDDSSDNGKRGAVEALLQSMEEETDALKATMPEKESKKVAEHSVKDNLDQLLELLSSPDDNPPVNSPDSYEESVDEPENRIEVEETPLATESVIEDFAEDNDDVEITLAGSIEKSLTSIEGFTTSLSDEVSPDTEKVREEEVAEEVETVDACFLCHRLFGEDDKIEDVSVRLLYEHCKACEDAYKEGKNKPNFSSPIAHIPVTSGCAFSSEADTACIYSSTPVQLSDEFYENILDCSEFTGNLQNLILFIEASTEAEHISVECVQYYGIEGLLFYISGAYYFITGGYTTNAALKKLFSDATKHAFYSVNPILVHVKLSHFGIHHAKIESLAVLYSIFVGTKILLPPALFFNVDHSLDMYRSIMPQYEFFFSKVELTVPEQEQYVRLKKLEWGLASSVDISFITFGKNKSVYGSNALNYRFSLFESERICREGTLLIITLAEDSALPSEEEKEYWEDVVGRISSSSLSCLNYSFLLGLGGGVSYFTYFEEDAFYDSLMASARSAYKKAYKKEVHLNVVKEQFVTN